MRMQANSTGDSRRWWTLAVVASAFFMTVLDVAVVNVAIPSIEAELHVAESTVQWVLTAYAITFGGFLLLAGRLADVLGRRLIFVSGVTLFTLASLVCGLAHEAGVLIGARAVQGTGAALIPPAALSIVTTSFAEGPERNRALGIWGAIGAAGAAVGVLLGGIITEFLGWEWIFFVNVPVGVAVLALTTRLVPESRQEMAQRRFDALGAVTVTAGLALLVYAISEAPNAGWGATRTIAGLIAAVALIGTFIVIELRSRAPLMPFTIFRNHSLVGANVVGFLLGAALFANFFVLTLYLQQVLGWSPLETGFAFLATAAPNVLFASLAQRLTTRHGARPVLVLGLVVIAVSMVWYTRLPVDGHYWPDLLPAFLAFAFGLALSFVPVSIAALSQVERRDAGLASGLINTNQQIGGAIGVAVASTIFVTRADNLVEAGDSRVAALTSGYHLAFWALTAIAAAGALAAFILLREPRGSATEVEPVARAGLTGPTCRWNTSTRSPAGTGSGRRGAAQGRGSTTSPYPP